jgi:hypothetical protein
MLDLVNRTRFETALAPYTDARGMNHVCVTIKSTWSIAQNGKVTPAEEQQPILRADVRAGDSVLGSLHYALDFGWPKVNTDVALVGHAHARDGRTTELDVGLLVGPIRKVVRVFGERVWYRGGGSWAITPPKPFERMPLIYERAYGGRDDSHPDSAKHAWEARNPIGTGFAATGSARRLDGLKLPNLETPSQLITSWSDRPPPAGFGLLDAHWQPRSRFAGTYDERWRQTRAPLLPDDFDPRFFNAAHPDLIAKGHLVGGEPVAISNADPTGTIRFDLPVQRFDVIASIKGRRVSAPPALDTVWIDTDERRVILVWRASLACPRSLIALDAVLVRSAS